MPERNMYFSCFPESPPHWYWISGLHDACISKVEFFEFPFDHGEFIRDKKHYNRNLLLLKINSKSALYDNTIKEIRFWNYKILSEDITLEGSENMWWLSDRLIDHDEYYTLEIDLYDGDYFTFKIKFERAEVDRK